VVEAVVEVPTPIAIGRLGPGDRWIGLLEASDGFEVVVGSDGDVLGADAANASDVLALAHAYFSEALDPPSAALEATHGDVADAVRAAVHRANPAQRAPMVLVLDAIDDGLAIDEVLARVGAALPAGIADDVVDYLRRRAAAIATS
jgi:hypothetical protein